MTHRILAAATIAAFTWCGAALATSPELSSVAYPEKQNVDLVFAKMDTAPAKAKVKGSRLEGEITKLRFLTPEVAVIHRVGHVLLPEASEEKNSSIQTLIAVKRQDTWYFAAFQNTDVHSYL